MTHDDMVDIDRIAFRGAIDDKMVLRQITQEILAQRAKCPPAYISQGLSGKRTRLKRTTVAKWAEVLGVPVSSLIATKGGAG